MAKKTPNHTEDVVNNSDNSNNSGKKWEYVEKSAQQEEELKASMGAHHTDSDNNSDIDIEYDDDVMAGYAKLSQAELIKALVKAKQEAKDNWDALLRAKAETQNIMGSADREKQNIRNYAIKSFVQSLISVVDNFERSLEQADQSKKEAINIDALIEGIELTRKDFLSTLEKFGVEVLNPVNEKFDPQYHEAMSMVPSDEHEPNSVVQVLQKGYTLNQRLVRPAMVIVANKK